MNNTGEAGEDKQSPIGKELPEHPEESTDRLLTESHRAGRRARLLENFGTLVGVAGLMIALPLLALGYTGLGAGIGLVGVVVTQLFWQARFHWKRRDVFQKQSKKKGARGTPP